MKVNNIDFLEKFLIQNGHTNELVSTLKECKPRKIQKIFKKREDAYSNFNITKKYTGDEWKRFEAIVKSVYPDIILYPGPS